MSEGEGEREGEGEGGGGGGQRDRETETERKRQREREREKEREREILASVADETTVLYSTAPPSLPYCERGSGKERGDSRPVLHGTGVIERGI